MATWADTDWDNGSNFVTSFAESLSLCVTAEADDQKHLGEYGVSIYDAETKLLYFSGEEDLWFKNKRDAQKWGLAKLVFLLEAWLRELDSGRRQV